MVWKCHHVWYVVKASTQYKLHEFVLHVNLLKQLLGWLSLPQINFCHTEILLLLV